MKSLQQQNIIILYDFIISYDFFCGISVASFKENTIKAIYTSSEGFAETFCWSFFGKKVIAH